MKERVNLSVTPILIICFCQHCVKRETRHITTKIVTFIPKIIRPTTLTNHSHRVIVTLNMKFLAAFGATTIKEFVYKCSIQKKRQIQLVVRDRMNSMCPMNFFVRQTRQIQQYGNQALLRALWPKQALFVVLCSSHPYEAKSMKKEETR